MGETEGKKDEADYKRLQTFPLVRHSDMPEEMRVETMELCVTACEKFSNNNENIEAHPGIHPCLHSSTQSQCGKPSLPGIVVGAGDQASRHPCENVTHQPGEEREGVVLWQTVGKANRGSGALASQAQVQILLPVLPGCLALDRPLLIPRLFPSLKQGGPLAPHHAVIKLWD
ncbi:dynein axonemal light chain 4 isoform X1 [Erinaceus europaeus]|uniref:Dynein axonemal light chain 4 isoform X1 n=1 Tax=Erinaceus europaeus TaxID=9365 RepID=A0ABM3X829_ERIEU|nr:dynein axonemal light chain 4 isoform X1 [Erinaceus europaeus]XP_060044964.1 dynein axonemal light chain 4 isoform X1 [Erinaceus europaeus]